jgi:membrane protease YdiL (CAAX protease family)
VNKSKFIIKKEFSELTGIIKGLDKKVITIFISVAVLQTVSWYYSSRMFFKLNIFDALSSNSNVFLYEFAYWYAGDFITLFIIPALIVKFIFKEKLRDYGVSSGEFRTGIKLSILFLAFMIPLIWLATSQPAFSLTYPLLDRARDSWNIFILYESGLLFYLFAWEFIWRGFMLFGLKEKFGYYAVVIQMIPFLILHNGKPPVETFGAILGGIALGILAYRTQSIYYCVVTHAGIMICVDLFAVLRHRAGDFGIGITSMLHILKQII